MKMPDIDKDLFDRLCRDAQFREEVKQSIQGIEKDHSRCKRDKCGHKTYDHSDTDGGCYLCECEMMVI